MFPYFWLCDLKMSLSCHFSRFILFMCYIAYFDQKKEGREKGMEGRRGNGCGAGRGREARHSQEPRNEREAAAEQDHGPRVEVGDEIAKRYNK